MQFLTLPESCNPNIQAVRNLNNVCVNQSELKSCTYGKHYRDALCPWAKQISLVQRRYETSIINNCVFCFRYCVTLAKQRKRHSNILCVHRYIPSVVARHSVHARTFCCSPSNNGRTGQTCWIIKQELEIIQPEISPLSGVPLVGSNKTLRILRILSLMLHHRFYRTATSAQTFLQRYYFICPAGISFLQKN